MELNRSRYDTDKVINDLREYVDSMTDEEFYDLLDDILPTDNNPLIRGTDDIT